MDSEIIFGDLLKDGVIVWVDNKRGRVGLDAIPPMGGNRTRMDMGDSPDARAMLINDAKERMRQWKIK